MPEEPREERNPNTTQFPRGGFLRALRQASSALRERIHPLQREELEPDFRRVDPKSWPHSLGAADVFLDNLGLLLAEQLSDPSEVEAYIGEMTLSMAGFERAKLLICKDWVGRYLLGATRVANSGEPRPVLRLLQLMQGAGSLGAGSNVFGQLDPPERSTKWDTDPSVNWGRLFPLNWGQRPASAIVRRSLGIELDGDWSPFSPPPRLLPLDQATPDLPVRVLPGVFANSTTFDRKFVRDQGNYPTCAASAVAAALTLAAVRAGHLQIHAYGFSAAWIHYASADGGNWDSGRRLGTVIDSVRRELPCSEAYFPYADGPRAGEDWRDEDREAESQEFTDALGELIVVQIAPHEIARIKTYLAAGWVVVASTFFPERWFRDEVHRFGIPPLPLAGEPRASAGHAWTLVGYDHVDGNKSWKYQGRFFCLNSWGPRWPRVQPWGPGICSLPFAALLTEGKEAYAIRFSRDVS